MMKKTPRTSPTEYKLLQETVSRKGDDTSPPDSWRLDVNVETIL